MAIIKTQSEIAASDLDTDQVMHLAAKRAQEITGATSAVIELPEGEEMVYAVTSGEATPYLGIRMDRRSTLSGLALDRDQVLYCEDTEIDPRVDRRASRRVNLRSMICVPLKHQGRRGRRAQGLLAEAAPFRPRRRRDAQPAERRDLRPYGPRLPLRARGQGGQDGRAHRPLNRRAYEERRWSRPRGAHATAIRSPSASSTWTGSRPSTTAYGHPAGDEVLAGRRGGDRLLAAHRRRLPDRRRRVRGADAPDDARGSEDRREAARSSAWPRPSSATGPSPPPTASRPPSATRSACTTLPTARSWRRSGSSTRTRPNNLPASTSRSAKTTCTRPASSTTRRPSSSRARSCSASTASD